VSPARTAAVVLGALVLQVCLFARFSFDGARPDVVVLVAVLAGYVAGPERGAVVAFAAGTAFDLLLTTPLGLSALVYSVVAYGVGVATAGLLRSSRWIPSMLAAVGSAVAMLAYALIGELFGQATLSGPPLASIIVYVAVINAVLAPLAARALRWARVDERERRAAFLGR
jgi:rod shape-determining protein MreD